MKKYFLFACVAAALVSCSSDEFLGENQGLTQENGAIVFTSANQKAQRATAGAAAADLLGGNFIVEGFKGAETATAQASDLVFDNYLVVWGQNTAGKTEDNTNDWKYVGVTESNKMAASELTGLGRTISEQSIKYWDYSTSNYAFAAYSAGTLNMVSGTSVPVAGVSVHVTKITDPLGANAYTFTAKNATDLSKCYYTDVTPVAKVNYNKPVTLNFKNLAAKVRIGMYETVPGYSVKDVQFFADGTSTYVAVAAAQVTKKDVFAVDVYDDTHAPLHSAGDDWADGTYYDIAGTSIAEAVAKKTVLTSNYYDSDGSHTYAKGTVYNGGTTYYAPKAGDDATFYLTGTNKFPEAGAITVGFPLLGTSNSAKNGYNKADVTVAPEAGSTTTTKTFGALTDNYTTAEKSEAAGKYLGRELAKATMAGASTDNYFTPVIPVSTEAALTLRVNYTLVSTDGSGEEIHVWGAKAVVPANFCEWQPNYAYTYIFKISDNTNGSTDKLGSTTEGLFPITFDAVVADITDASAEQTTVTTVATPSVTTYQYGHKQGEEYKAGDIYVEVVKDADLETLTSKATLYTTTDDLATEADVIDALQMSTATSPNIVGRNGLTLVPETTPIDLGAHSIPAVDGTTISVAAGKSAKFTAVADKNYVFVYDYTTGTPTQSVLYSFDNAASAVGATEPTDWAGNYFTKTVVAGVVTYTPATTFVASTAVAPQYYYKKYVNNGRNYAVKVIKTGTAYVVTP